MNNDIENLIEAMTKVRPEMLNEEALKLFNTIMKILDERDSLKNEIKDLKKKLTPEEMLEDLEKRYEVYGKRK